jgi:hypothetical protein
MVGLFPAREGVAMRRGIDTKRLRTLYQRILNPYFYEEIA